MNIPRAGVLVVGTAAILFAAGCAGGQAAPTRDIDATAEARVEPAEVSLSVPTASVPTAAALPNSTPLPFFAPVPTPAPQSAVKEVPVGVGAEKEVEKIGEGAVTATPSLLSTSTPSPTPVPAPNESEEFWNRARVGRDGEPLPSCGDSIFSHPVVGPGDATPFFWEKFGYPHGHMVYWSARQLNEEFPAPGVPASVLVQLFAPADIYIMNFGRSVRESQNGGTYEEWGPYTIICDGHSLFWGHVGRPAEEILDEFRKTVPVEWTDCPVSTTEEALVTTEIGECRWQVYFNPPISAGTPLWKSSGYSTGFDLGLQLFGLTAEELQQHSSYGYSINPWVHSGGNSVCTLEYFPEPYRTAYLESMAGRCGPINQDVPGTAMGIWLPIRPPADGSIPDHGQETEWNALGEGTISGLYLYENWLDESVHKLNIGSQLPEIPAGMYRFETVADGLVNREWDSVVAGEVYCSELRRQMSVWGSDDTVTGVVLVEVSEDGRTLTIEGITGTQCPGGRYSFSTDAHTMYR